MLSLCNIDVVIRGRAIIKDFSVTAFATCILNLYGPNGSGKSSLLQHIVGLREIQPGQILYDQVDVYSHMSEYRMMSEYVGHRLGLKENLTVRDNLKLWACLYDNELMMAPAVRALNLEQYLDYQIAELSMGLKKIVALARILITNSTIWLLDEPLANLDSGYRKVILTLMQARCEQNGVVIMSSHEPLDERFVCNICVSDFAGSGYEECE